MSYVFDASTDPTEVKRRRRIAEALLEKGMDTSPILSPWQGAARMGQALMGGWELGREDKRDREQDTAFQTEYGKPFGATPTVSSALSASTPMPPEQVKAIIDANVPEGYRNYAYTMAKKESNFNPSIVSPTGAKGLFQFTSGTGKSYGLIDDSGDYRDDPVRNTKAFVQFTEANREGLRRVLGREPTMGELAVAHQQGLGGATALLTGQGTVNPQNLAVQAGNPKNAADIQRYYGFAPDAVISGGSGQPTMAGGSDTLQPAQPAAPNADAMMQRAMRLGQLARTPAQMQAAKFAYDQAKQAAEEAQKARDPARALQMEKSRLEIDRLKNPQAPEAARKLEIINQQRQAAGLPPLRIDEYETNLRKAGSASNTVNVGGGSDKQIFDAIEADAKEARAAVTGLQAIQEARKAIAGGGIFGAGADARLGLQKVGALLGVTDPKVIQNTETFRAAIAPQVSAMLKATVGTSQISNTDREFAEKAAGGSITLDEGSIKRLLDIMEKAGRGRIESYQKRLDTVYPDGPEGKFARERALFGLTGIPEQMPEPATQTGQPLPRKSVGGKTYEKRADGWYEVK